MECDAVPYECACYKDWKEVSSLYSYSLIYVMTIMLYSDSLTRNIAETRSKMMGSVRILFIFMLRDDL